MAATSYVSSESIMTYAERELAAFRRALIGVVGDESLECAIDIWIRALESLDCLDEDFEKFFRNVTIQTAGQLAKCTKAA
jgi:hypothetical protein